MVIRHASTVLGAFSGRAFAQLVAHYGAGYMRFCTFCFAVMAAGMWFAAGSIASIYFADKPLLRGGAHCRHSARTRREALHYQGQFGVSHGRDLCVYRAGRLPLYQLYPPHARFSTGTAAWWPDRRAIRAQQS
jgi:hypothetical protein